jgi:pentatricopeptide repeat domain-containing protein 1
MIKRGFLPSPDVFDLLLMNLFKEGRIGNICRLLGKLVDNGFVPPISTYDILIYGMCKCEEIDKAFKSWEILMQFRLPGVKAYRALVQGLCNLGRVAEAKLVFRKTMEKGGVGDDAAHDVLILRLKQAGRVIDARECQEVLDRRRQREACDGELSSRSILAGDDDSDGGGSHSAEDFSGDEQI